LRYRLSMESRITGKGEGREDALGEVTGRAKSAAADPAGQRLCGRNWGEVCADE